MYSNDFPQVQDNILDYVGHGTPQPNIRGRMIPKGTQGRGSSPTGTKSNRPNYQIHEANGPRCYIQATLYKSNAADASQQPRSLRIMPSAAGISDFWAARTLAG